MIHRLLLVVLFLLLPATRLAAAGPAADDVAVDADGDGDVDADDRAILEASEVIEVEPVTAGETLERSARAVTVIETERARERTADLGEVLSRAQGVQVRRTGGLGSTARFSLNGLYDDQVRFFLDGVPLDFTGWGDLGVANVPVNLVERIEVHRGVVPVALGADALGGAVDLVRDERWSNHASASYQVGSFGVHRAGLSARGRHDATGLVGGASISLDRARNDYPIDVEVPDDEGRLHPATVRRFHDDYTAGGATLEAGVVDRGWLRRAIARFYGVGSDKDLQHNLVMTVPYGEVDWAGKSIGSTADVVVDEGPWSGRLLVGTARRWVDFQDVGEWIYDWTGARVRQRAVAGEIAGEPIDQTTRETGLFARVTGERALGGRQRLRLVIAPTAALRDGRDHTARRPEDRDPLRARRDLVQIVSGLEHELRLGDDEVESIAFAKHYVVLLDGEDPLPGGGFAPIDRTVQRIGFGDQVRWAMTEHVALKASYEWATRLPGPDEVFGDGVLIQPNLALDPESSHNANLGARAASAEGRIGTVGGEVNLFARLADQLILLLGNDRYFTYQNVYAVRVLGVEGTAGWVAPGGWASVEGSATFQDVRNASADGAFGAYEGDRLPNRPWLLGALTAEVRRRGLATGDDELSLFGDGRYVHEFYRGWESLGSRDSKQVVPGQLVFGLGVTYAWRGALGAATTVELQNLTDARVFDSFGVQRPGRSLGIKLSAEL